MMELTLNTPMMTSREIAELTGKEHGHVMRDIRVMLTELHGESGLSNFGSSYLNSQNKEQPEFCLPKRETLILVSGYSVAMRARIIDRWQELEAKQNQPLIPQTLPEALRLAADLADQRNKAQAMLSIAATKAEALDRIATHAEGAMCITNAAKALQMQPKQFFLWLQQHDWIFRRTGGAGWVAYQTRLKAGLLEHKITTVARSDGTEKVCEQVLVTARGLAMLSQAVHEKLAA